jgi:hypothetical protein
MFITNRKPLTTHFIVQQNIHQYAQWIVMLTSMLKAKQM